MKRQAFTLLEVVVAICVIAVLVGIAAAKYSKAKWDAGIAGGAIENRQRLNQAVANGKFRKQKHFDETVEQLKRQNEIGLAQGR